MLNKQFRQVYESFPGLVYSGFYFSVTVTVLVNCGLKICIWSDLSDDVTIDLRTYSLEELKIAIALIFVLLMYRPFLLVYSNFVGLLTMIAVFSAYLRLKNIFYLP